MTATFLVVAMALQGFVQLADDADSAWTLQFVSPSEGPRFVEARGWSREQLAALAADGEAPARVLEVRVVNDSEDALPAVLGDYAIVDGAVRFTPRYPFGQDVAYRARLRAESIVRGSQADATVELAFSLIRPSEPATSMAAVYPSSKVLPENQLKFYLHFTAPVRRGEAYARIALYDLQSGDRVQDPFLELGEELWDPAGLRFTLLIDPGRIKRGLKPREEVGPVLESGKAYRLVIDDQWKDARGRPLAQTWVKEFRVGEPTESQPDPERWRLTAPKAGGREALVVAFEKPLDHALAQRLLEVVAASGEAVAGSATLGEDEQSWLFTPHADWAAGGYALRVDVDLEDLAGNSIRKPFEVDVTGPVRRQRPGEQREVRSIPFDVR